MRYVPYDPAPSHRPPKAAVAIRVATELDELIGCARLSAEYNEEDYRTALVNVQRHLIRPRNCVHIAVAPGERIVGYGRTTWVQTPPDPPPNVTPQGYYLGGLVVAADYRRRGVGDRLTAERLKLIGQRKQDAWYLVNRRNTASIALHDAHGFHESTRDFVFPGLVADEPGGILLHARLGPDASDCPGCAVSA